MVASDRGNQQYLPDLTKHILDVSSLTPLWTGVMCTIFQYGGVTATSAPVKTYLHVLKNVVFKHLNSPMWVNDFVFHHIAAIEGAMKLASAKVVDDNEPK